MVSFLRIALLITGIIPLLICFLLIETAGIKGFNGTGGEDTMLFQILTYACIPVVLGGLLSILTGLHPSRTTGLISSLLMILPALFLSLLSPLYGGPIIIMGIITLIISRRIDKKIVKS